MSKLAGHDPNEAKDGRTHEHDGYPPHSHDVSPHHTVQGLKRKKRSWREAPHHTIDVQLDLDSRADILTVIRLLASVAMELGASYDDVAREVRRATF